MTGRHPAGRLRSAGLARPASRAGGGQSAVKERSLVYLEGLQSRSDGGPVMSTMVATPAGVGLEPEAMPRADVAPEELLAMPDGGHYELIDGEMRERHV